MMVPSEEQCRTLKLWLDGARFAYNLAVDAYNASGVYAKNALKGLAGASTGRKRRKRDKQTGELVGEPIAAGENAWQKNAPERLWTVPAKIRSRAVEVVTNAIESFKAVATNKGKPLPKLKHRKSKDKVQTFVVEAGMVNCGKAGAAYPLFGGPGARGAMRFGQKGKKKKPFVLPDTIDSDMTVTYERKSGRFYLGIPVPLDDHCPDITRDATVADGRVGIDPERSWHIAAIDPGIKTFATVYDPGRERVVSCGTHGGRKDGSARGAGADRMAVPQGLAAGITRHEGAEEEPEAQPAGARAARAGQDQAPDGRAAPQGGAVAVPQLLGRAAAKVRGKAAVRAQRPDDVQEIGAAHAGPGSVQVQAVPAPQSTRVWHQGRNLQREVDEQDVHRMRPHQA